jgi:hypothetical protein
MKSYSVSTAYLRINDSNVAIRADVLIRILATKPCIIGLKSLWKWSGKPGSNWRPQPWQGCALPTELFPLLSGIIYIQDN